MRKRCAAGRNGTPRLLLMIDQADVFQLFWSTNAQTSGYVREEWTHALELHRPEFIRPVHWEEPMPTPPQELAHIHFARYALPS
jgi:hypothetical protein